MTTILLPWKKYQTPAYKELFARVRCGHNKHILYGQVYLHSSSNLWGYYGLDEINNPLREEFPALKKRLPCLWTNSNFISTCGTVSLQTVMKYIEDQKGE